VGLLIQEIIQSRAAIRAWSDLDDERSNCEECEGQMIHLSEIGEVTEEQMKAMASVPPNPTLKFDHCSTEKEKA
jgi:predicted methyltransferase